MEMEMKEKGKSKQKKKSVRVDFTPMVDMNMLLITFFMLCTSLSKPQTMEISMQTKDKVTAEEQTKVQDTRAITFILDGKNRVFYYLGEPNYSDYKSLIESDYTANGLRAMLLKRNKKVVADMDELKKKKLNLKITDEQFTEESLKIKDDKSAPVVIIKATDKANYKNLIDALDEMQICSIGKYAIVDITPADEFLLANYEAKGTLNGNSVPAN